MRKLILLAALFGNLGVAQQMYYDPIQGKLVMVPRNFTGPVTVGATAPAGAQTPYIAPTAIYATGTYGSDLVTNGSFSTDTDWTKGTCWTITGGKAHKASGSSCGAISQSITLTAGYLYKLVFTLSSVSGGASDNLFGCLGNQCGDERSFAGTFTAYIVAVDTSALKFVGDDTLVADLDSVSVKRVMNIGEIEGPVTFDSLITVDGMRVVSPGRGNVGLGEDALLNLQSYANTEAGIYEPAHDNTAIGALTMQAAQFAHDNTAIGKNAMQNGISPNDDIGIGNNALRAVTTGGQYNIAIGNDAGLSVTTGTDNVLLGHYAGRLFTAAQYNVGIGSFVFEHGTTGGGNTAIGQSAMNLLTTGADNTGAGYHVLEGNVTGRENAAFGESALRDGTSANFRTALGLGAGRNSGADGGVFLGYKAGYYETAANKLFIDNAIRTNEADGRAKALIYGVFDAATANQVLTFNAATIYLPYLPTTCTAKPTNSLASIAGVITLCP